MNDSADATMDVWHDDEFSDDIYRGGGDSSADAIASPALKHALPFILNAGSSPSPVSAPTAAHSTVDHDTTHVAFVSSAAAAMSAAPSTDTTAQPRSDKKRGRMCKTDGCENYIVHKGLCCRHGGGKKCSVEGCNTSAKHRGVCWKHGGSTKCRIDACDKRAKAKGLCWGHGGGTKCVNDECDKVAVSNGSCWAHGGGKRCIFDGCSKPGYERTQNFCIKHHAELQDVTYYEV